MVSCQVSNWQPKSKPPDTEFPLNMSRMHVAVAFPSRASPVPLPTLPATVIRSVSQQSSLSPCKDAPAVGRAWSPKNNSSIVEPGRAFQIEALEASYAYVHVKCSFQKAFGFKSEYRL